jgi:hypothetical protein
MVFDKILRVSLIAVLFCSGVLYTNLADAHQCRYLKPDPRNLCLAKKEEARFYCRYIKDPDQQRYCFAYLDKTPEQCNAIQDETLKAQCEVEAQARLDEAIAIQKAAEEKAKAEAEAAKALQEANKAPAQQGR